MRREVRSISSFEIRKCVENNAEADFSSLSTSLLPIKKSRSEQYGDEDRTSSLPDEILVCILSCLTMKGAARTSVLARRWRYLWTFYSGTLNFDCSKLMLPIQKLDFVDWVNLVLKSIQGSIIDEIKVCVDLDTENFKCDIDSWVEFAIEKKVSRLHLDLTGCQGSNSKPWGRYSFPSHLLKCSSFRSLTTLCLIHIDVSGEVIEYLLSNASLLESLRIINSASLMSLKVCDSQLPSLKYLEIDRCQVLVHLEISAANLVSFKYVGPNIDILFKSVPHLVEVSFDGLYNDIVPENLSQLSCYNSLLETVALRSIVTHEHLQLSEKIPEFSNLKHLKLGILLRDVHCLLPCTNLLKAFPCICELTLEIKFRVPPSWNNDARKIVKDDNPHQCLKVLKLVGFWGIAAEVDAIMCFVENAVLLEKIIIEPSMLMLPRVPSRGPKTAKSRAFEVIRILVRERFQLREEQICELARQRAKDLGAILPPNIEFVVL